MEDEFLRNPRVRAVVLELTWGDRFESDLRKMVEGVLEGNGLPFEDIREGLLERNLVYRFRGGRGSPYLSLTDRGVMVGGKLKRLLEE